MQLSYYLKVYPSEEEPGRVLLYSTKNASLILLDEETYAGIEKGALSDSDAAVLKELGMVVEDRAEEKQAVLAFMDECNEANTELQLVVVLNLDCNFACLYCYEGERKGHLYMAAETAEVLVDFIKERFTDTKKSLIIDFYGGEPLLSLGLVTSISQVLKPFVESRGGSYTFTLVTNGSLFTRKAAEELAPLGLESVKITIDGPADVHNRYRPFKSGKGSFDVILRNIKETCDVVKIGIGGNFDETSYKRFPLLLDHLLREGLTPDKIYAVKFDPIMKGLEGDRSPVDYHGGCMSINEPWIVEAAGFLREEVLKRGFYTPKMAPVFCMIENRDAYVVNFDGTIYKCPAFIGQEGFAVGDLWSGVRDYTEAYNLGIWKSEECAGCEYLPFCFGGCRYMSLIRDGNIAALDCKKTYLDEALERMVKQDVRYRRKAAG